MREPMYKNRIRGVSVGRAGRWSPSPYLSRAQSVNSVVVRRRRSSLPREIRCRSRKRDWEWSDSFWTLQRKSAAGVVGHAVGEVNEALQGRKAEPQLGWAGNDGWRPKRSSARRIKRATSKQCHSRTTSGRRTSYSSRWPFPKQEGVKPRRVGGEGPNRQWWSPCPKVRLVPNS